MSLTNRKRNPYRNVSPSVLLRAVESANEKETGTISRDSIPGKVLEDARDTIRPDSLLTTDDPNLEQSIRDASLEERQFGLRVGRSAQLLREWCQEVESWGVDAQAEHVEGPSNAGNDEKGVVAQWLHTTSDIALRYTERIPQLRDGLSSLDVEAQKAVVLNTHHGYKRLSGDQLAIGQQQEGKLTDLGALTTAIVLESLPYYGRILHLLDTWTARLNTLHHAQGFEMGLEKLKYNLAQAWALFRPDTNGKRQDGQTGSVTVERAEYDILRQELSQRSLALGKQLDAMLDGLEGRPDTLPLSWIEDVDVLEGDVTRWTAAAETQVKADDEQARLAKFKDEQSSRRIRNGDPKPPLLGSKDHDAAKVSRPESPRSQKRSATNVPEILIDGMLADSSMPHEATSQHLGHSSFGQSSEKHITSINAEPDETPSPEAQGSKLSEGAASNKLVDQPHGVHLERNTSDSQLLQHRDATPSLRHARTSTLEKTLFLSGRGVKQLHRRNSSAELLIGDASVASGFSMAEVKRVNITRTRSDTAQMHQRKISDKLMRSSLQDLSEEAAHSSSFLPRPDPSIRSPNRGSAQVDTKGFARSKETYEVRPASAGGAATFLQSLPPSRDAMSIVIPSPTHRPLDAAESDSMTQNEQASAVASEPSSPNDDIVTTRRQESVHKRPTTTPIKARPGTPMTSTDDRIERRIDRILHTLPTRINFDKRATKRSESRLSSASSIAESTPSPPSRSQPTSGARPKTPHLTLMHVDQPYLNSSTSGVRSKSSSSGIRLYHLHSTGASQPIKLFVRLVGDEGRVMVRVGGGWEDLEKYLRDYSAHHSSTVVTLPAASARILKTPTGDPNATKDRRAFTVPTIIADRSTSSNDANRTGSAQSVQAVPRPILAPAASPAPAYGQTLQIPKRSTPGSKTVKRSSSMQKLLDTTSSGLPRPVPSSAKLTGEDSTEDGQASDGSQSPGHSPSHITAERRQWLSEMVKKAKKWKAEGGIGGARPPATGIVEVDGSNGINKDSRRVYRRGDGVLKEM